MCKKYFECSSTLGINVHEIFNEIALIAYNELFVNRRNSFSLSTHKKGKKIKKSKNEEKSQCC